MLFFHEKSDKLGDYESGMGIVDLYCSMLGKLMKIEKLSESEQMDVIIDFFSDYIGEELLDDMEYETLSDIYELWLNANSRAEGLTMGESSPSAGS